MARLAQYAARRNLQLATAAGFNAKLRELGCPKGMTVQKVCRLARDEVRRTLDYVWSDSEGAARILEELQEGNEDLYRFENLNLTLIHPTFWTDLHEEGPGRPVEYQPECDLRALILRQRARHLIRKVWRSL